MARRTRARDATLADAVARAEQAEELLDQAQRLAGIGSWDADVRRGTAWWSAEQYRLLEVDATEAVGFDTFLSRVHPDDRDMAREARERAERDAEPYDYLCRVILPSGRERILHARGDPVLDDEGRVVRLHGTTQDVTDAEQTRAALEQSRAELVHQALHDQLTRLPNRALIEDRLGHALELQRRDGGVVAVLFVDVDRFKRTNDGLGHDVGDQVLVEVARRLREVVRDGDTVARFGGDEFVVVAEGLRDANDAEAAACRIIDGFRRPLLVGERALTVSVSVGIAVSGPSGENGLTDPLLMVRDADSAMYRAKEAGRDRYAFFDASAREVAERRLELEQGLRHAIDAGELEFHYQPQFSLTDGSLAGAEALMRWKHPRDGLLRPAEFIPLAEESGLIEGLGAWGVREGCRQAARWADRCRTSRVAPPQVVVNVAVLHLTAPGFVEHLEACLGGEGLGVGALCIEITESLPIPDLDAAFRRLKDVRALGVDISLDDFGTGYSSLGHFSTLPIDWVKIDQSFVAALGQDATALAVIESVIRIAETRSIKTVGEGVETAEQAEMLRDLGCGFAQGYHFARPMPAAELEQRFLR